MQNLALKTNTVSEEVEIEAVAKYMSGLEANVATVDAIDAEEDIFSCLLEDMDELFSDDESCFLIW